jgi:hypothetical protein
VALAVTHQGSHGPGRTRALTHPGLQPTAWSSRKASRRSPSAFRGKAAEPRCTRPLSRTQVCRPTLRSPYRVLRGEFPLLRRYDQCATTSCRPRSPAMEPHESRLQRRVLLRVCQSPASFTRSGLGGPGGYQPGLPPARGRVTRRRDGQGTRRRTFSEYSRLRAAPWSLR